MWVLGEEKGKGIEREMLGLTNPILYQWVELPGPRNYLVSRMSLVYK